MRVWATPLFPWGLVDDRTMGLGPEVALCLVVAAVEFGLSAAWTDFRRSAGTSGLVMGYSWTQSNPRGS